MYSGQFGGESPESCILDGEVIVECFNPRECTSMRNWKERSYPGVLRKQFMIEMNNIIQQRVQRGSSMYRETIRTS